MTPEQERALLSATAAGLDDDVREAYAELVQLIRDGVVPREAVAEVMTRFQGDMAGTMATALSAVMSEAVGTASILALQVGTVSLSTRLYQEAAETGEVVQGIVDRHLRGFADARALALQLFEGYTFRDAAAEPLQISRRNRSLPRYMREALLSDAGLERDLAVHFARLQVNGLQTPALRAAYAGVLDAIAALEGGKGRDVLEKRLEVAFYERVRYFSQRIAQTEIHRAFARRQAVELMDDADVEFVQVRRAPGRGEPCICVLYTGRDLYGMGPGVYPKARAPLPPFHPYCLPGDALVSASGRVLAVSKRWFDGDLAVITTASGKRLAATVNHPVLTRRGWVGAGLLDVGDEVIARLGGVAVGAHTLGDDQHQDVPARIAEIADAFFGSREVTAREVPMTAEHFHGDGVSGDVAVIGADRKLWNWVNSATSQVGGDHQLPFAVDDAAGLLRQGYADLGLEAARGATDCSVCGGSVRATFFGRELAHPDDVRSAVPAALDAGLSEPQVDDVAADAELGRQIQDGATGEVFADNVVRVERVQFAGHVFNLETDQGHYTANGIVTHNCRCVIAPRLDLTGRRAQPEDLEQDAYFLRRLGARTGAQVIGSRAKLALVLETGRRAEDVAALGRRVPAETVGQAGR